MIAGLFTVLKSAAILLLLLLLLAFAPSLSLAAEGAQASGRTAQARFSANDFDWREMVSYLNTAATLPAEDGIKTVLEHSKTLRIYVANEVRADCHRDSTRCPANIADRSALDLEVNKRIDGIVREGIFHRRKTAIVDYTLERQPFPFSEIAAEKSENGQDAYYLLAFSGRNYTAMQLQQKYGAPYDTSISQWYSVFKYRLDTATYESKALFEVDPVDGAVLKVAINLKLRKAKKKR